MIIDSIMELSTGGINLGNEWKTFYNLRTKFDPEAKEVITSDRCNNNRQI
ncbi:Uncharacterised protein [Yersinia thracica]|uniref:Uncharacterized protein n=1 Tax=Yersinia thracica TaxID=2890319 RepID=A0A0T9Q707_9GAMM|nr:Uncharacterised protein [Yersinia thracica]